MCFKYPYRNKYMTLLLFVSLGLCCSHFSLSAFCERLLYEAPLMDLWGIYWTSVGDFVQSTSAYVCVYLQVCVLFGLSWKGPILWCFCTCVTHTSNPLDFAQNPEAEDVETESATIEKLLSYRTCLSTLDLCYRTELLCRFCCTFTYTHFDFICSLKPTHTHSVFWCMHDTDISEVKR